MMTRLIGLNVLADGSPSVNEDVMKQYLARLRPYATLIMDNVKMYQQTLSGGHVHLPIFRRSHRDDPKWHQIMRPQQWIDQNQPYFLEGSIIQVFNEPGGYEDLKPIAHWCAELLELIPQHVRLVLPNFSVGNPDLKRIEAGELDELFKALARHKRHFLGTHEYFRVDPLRETPDNSDVEEHRIGRYRAYYRRFEALGLPRPQIIVTEHGRDFGGGRGHNGDGWSRQMNEEQYAVHLKNAMEKIYSQDNVPVCIYGFGRGYNDDWVTFDISNARYVLDFIATLNDGLGDTFSSQNAQSESDPKPKSPPPVAPPPSSLVSPQRRPWQPKPLNPAGRKAYVGKVSALDGHWTQVYAEPTTAAKDVGDLMLSQRLIYYPDDVRAGFVNVEYDGIGGWVKADTAHVQFEGIEFVASDLPLPPSAPLPPGVTISGTDDPRAPGKVDNLSYDALLELAARYADLAAQTDGLIKRHAELSTWYHDLAAQYRTAAAQAADLKVPALPDELDIPAPPPVIHNPPSAPMPVSEGGYINVIIDISHHNRVTDFAAVRGDGILGIIHKATQGLTFVDSWYARRRETARAHGFLWGAFHFGTGGDVSRQVDHFVSVAKPDAQTLLALDWEWNPTKGQETMTREEAEAFVSQIHDRTGRYPVLYTRTNFLYKNLKHEDTILAKCPLWIADWSLAPVVPPQWSKIDIWQYTGDDKGPQPHTVRGIENALDRDKFNGGIEALRRFWGVV